MTYLSVWREIRAEAVAEARRLRPDLPATTPTPAEDPAPDPTLRLTVPVRCPRGGHPMRLVQMADPKGWADRERRAVLECTVLHCHHTAVVEVHLVDVGATRRGAA